MSLPLIVVGYGNSLTEGFVTGVGVTSHNYPATIAALHPDWTVVNKGTGNKTTSQMLANFQTEVHNVYFDSTKTCVCVFWEIADSMDDDGTTPSAELQKHKDAATLLHSLGWKIVVGTIIPLNDTSGTPTDRATFNSSLRADHAWADGYFDAEIDPIYQPIGNSLMYSESGSVAIHQTPYGYEHLASIINQPLAKIAGISMTIARTSGVFLGTDETTGVTITNNSTTTSSEIDLLGNDTSAGELTLFLKFTSTVTAGTLDVKLYPSRVTGQAYSDGIPLIGSPAPINGTQKIALTVPPGVKIPVTRYMTASVLNNATGASATNVTLGYDLTKYS